MFYKCIIICVLDKLLWFSNFQFEFDTFNMYITNINHTNFYVNVPRLPMEYIMYIAFKNIVTT